MLVADQLDHDKTNIQEFLLERLHFYRYFTIKTLVLDFLEEIVGIKRNSTVEFESYYRQYLWSISKNLKKLKDRGLIKKFNTRSYKVNKKKLIENDLNTYKRIKEKLHSKRKEVSDISIID